MYSNLDITLAVFFVIFVFIDIFVNIVLCMAIHRKRSLQTPMNLLIFHLAITDIVIGVFVFPRHVLSYAITYPNDTSSDYICRLVTGGSFIWTSVTAASGFLTIIALERLFAVVFPHKSQLRITKRRLKWLVPACWLSSLAFNIPSQLVLKYDHQNHFCMENWPDWVNPKAYVGLAFFAGNFSVFAMYIIYSIILYSLWKKHKAVNELSRAARIKARKRVTKMLILMTVVHMLCRTPNYTFYTLIYFDPDASYGSIVYNFTVFLILVNSASHPFFYCWYMDRLRREVFAMMPQWCRCPTTLRTFNLASTGDEVGTATPETGKKSRGEIHIHSCTLASESDTEFTMRKKKMARVHGEVNKEMEMSADNSSVDTSRKSSLVIDKKKFNVHGCSSNKQVENEEVVGKESAISLAAKENKDDCNVDKLCQYENSISESNAESDTTGKDDNDKDMKYHEDQQVTKQNDDKTVSSFSDNDNINQMKESKHKDAQVNLINTEKDSLIQDDKATENTLKQDQETRVNNNNIDEENNTCIEDIIVETKPVHV